MRYALVLTCALAGCAGLPSAPTEVRIPVPVACLERDQIPPRDFLPDAALAKLGDRELVISLRIEQLKQRTFIETASALLEACVTP